MTDDSGCQASVEDGRRHTSRREPMKAQLTAVRVGGGRCAAASVAFALTAMSVIATAQEGPVRRIRIPALIATVAFSPDGSTLTAWDPAGFSRWDAETGRQTGREPVFAKACERASVLPRSEDGRVIAVQCRDRIAFFEAATGQALGERQLREKETAALYTASPDGKAVAIVMAGAIDTVRLGDLSGGAPTEVPIESEVEQIILGSGGARLTVGSWRGVEIREVPDGTLLRSLAGNASHALSADGRTVALVGDRGPRVFDVDSGRLGRELEGRVSQLRFSPDGGLLVGWTNQRVIVWDLATGAQRLALNAGEFRVGEFVAASLAPDGRRLATVSLERRGERTASTVALWRLPSP